MTMAAPQSSSWIRLTSRRHRMSSHDSALSSINRASFLDCQSLTPAAFIGTRASILEADMDSRERTFLALSFAEPDGVPTDLWMSSGLRDKVESGWGKSEKEILDANDLDLRYIEGPRYVGPHFGGSGTAPMRTSGGCGGRPWSCQHGKAARPQRADGTRRFPLRGLANVSAEFTLLSTAFNLRTLWEVWTCRSSPAPSQPSATTAGAIL